MLGALNWCLPARNLLPSSGPIMSMSASFIAIVGLSRLDARLLQPFRPVVAPSSQPSRCSLTTLLRLTGGAADGSPLTIRVRSRDGLKRVTLPSADATLADLEKALRREHRLSVQPGQLSRGPGGAEPSRCRSS